ncbi:RING-type E3 ubiquitin transferase [Forsythia ovata]|uniref:RING-type E3 ubiquitin transferase n=1 Tax=Forsythia ovata TaxID=205694 RepID=A0ABD1UXC6_9LAMI
MGNSSPAILPISNLQHTTDATTTTTQQSAIANSTVRSLFFQISGTIRSGLSNSRPWLELVDRSAFSKPESISDATHQIRQKLRANACSGKIFVTVPLDHFGPITAEHDPERNLGVLAGETWEDMMEYRQWGAHFTHVAGIAGQSEYGAQSVALSGGYEDNEDHGKWFRYTGR